MKLLNLLKDVVDIMSFSSEPFYVYPKDKNGKKTGHTICVIYKYNRPFQGTSLCNPADQFDKEVGRQYALWRCEQAIRQYEKNRGLK